MPKPTTPTAPMVSYKIVGAATACQVSADYIRQAPVSYTHLTLPTICSV